jgi:hypothetical protein
MRVTGRIVGLSTLVVLVLTASTGVALHQGLVGQTGIDADTVVLEAGNATGREMTVLQFTWPADYDLQSSTPEPTTVANDRVIWREQQ